MLRVPITNIEPGMVLARPVPQPKNPRRVLLRRDDEIPMDVLPRLLKQGVKEVWVRYPELEFLEALIDEELEEHQREVYGHVRRNFEQIMRGTGLEMDIHQFRTSISDLFDYVKQSPCGSVLLQKLDAYDNYLMSHSTNVCYLALLMGIKLEAYIERQQDDDEECPAKGLQLLGLGCLLHDVGKMKIPAEILHKPGRLNDAEMELMKLHPIYGYEMVKGQVPRLAADIVLHHHQRWNGEGYPELVDPETGRQRPPLKGTKIPIFSRIATVVDVYDAATSQRCYSGAKLPVQVLHEMRTSCSGFFDAVVEEAFYQVIPPFPVGQVVALSDGVEAVVVDFNPYAPTRPKVQGIKDPNGTRFADPSVEEIDLALCSDLSIARVQGVDVRPFLASQTPSLQMI